MKIIESIQRAYDSQKLINDPLKKRVDDLFFKNKRDTWHYFSRTKSTESFALKLETGRFLNPNELEDFFACTLVVENLDQINAAIDLIKKSFTILEKRPRDASFTHKDPYSFQFDDLRLYVKLIHPDYLPPDPLSEIKFEIQVKTFLQHAWGIATHDLIYKSDSISWPKERIAFQIKAMLEQAEIIISGVDNISAVAEISKENFETKSLKKILSFYKLNFNTSELPTDVIRLCKTTKLFLETINIRIDELKDILEAENAVGRGKNLKNLSPFLIIIQSILFQRKEIFESYVNQTIANKFKIILPKELKVESINITNLQNVIEI